MKAIFKHKCWYNNRENIWQKEEMVISSFLYGHYNMFLYGHDKSKVWKDEIFQEEL